jgi:hypothetical protein
MKTSSLGSAIVGVCAIGFTALIRSCDELVKVVVRDPPTKVWTATDDALRGAKQAADDALRAGGQSGDDAVRGGPGKLPRTLFGDLADRTIFERRAIWSELPGEEFQRTELQDVRESASVGFGKRRVLAAFPSNESQYSVVYRRPWTASVESEAGRLRRLAETMSDVTFFENETYIELRAVLAAFDAGDVVVIVTHAVDDGLTLVLANGQRIRYSEVHRQCAESTVRCIVLSCKSVDLALSGEIETRDALELLKQTEAEGLTDYESYVRLLRERRAQQEQKHGIVITASVLGTGGVFLAVASHQRDPK